MVVWTLAVLVVVLGGKSKYGLCIITVKILYHRTLYMFVCTELYI